MIDKNRTNDCGNEPIQAQDESSTAQVNRGASQSEVSSDSALLQSNACPETCPEPSAETRLDTSTEHIETRLDTSTEHIGTRLDTSTEPIAEAATETANQSITETDTKRGGKTSATALSKDPKKQPKKRGLGSAVNGVLIGLIAVLAVLIVLLQVFVMCPVKQGSMTPTILDGERVMLLRGKGVKNGDIFVFDSGEKDENGDPINLIKRVLGVGGDRLLFVSEDEETVVLYRDSGAGFVRLEESYIADAMRLARMPKTVFCPVFVASAPAIGAGTGANENVQNMGGVVSENGEVVAAAEEFVITVPNGHYYALGDNRNESNDSRSFGFVQKRMVIGRMIKKLEKGSALEKFLSVLFWNRKAGCGKFTRVGRTAAFNV